MENIKILTIDDDATITKQIQDLFHDEVIEGHKILVDVENDFATGMARLLEGEYDIVVLDVYKGEPTEGNANQPGREILEEIKTTVPITLVFYTGLTSHIEECASDIVRVVSKTTSGGLETEITSLIKTGFPLIRKRISKHINDVLREYYWEVVDNYADSNKVSGEEALLEYLLLRRLAATLNREGATKIFGKAISSEKVHPLGFYICPPLQNDTYEMGDVLKRDDGSFHVVMTPSCDLANKKADYLLLVPTIKLKDTPEYKKYVECVKLNTEESLKKLSNNKESLSRVIGSRNSDRYFFLPHNEFVGMPDMVIDFQQSSNHKIEVESAYKLSGYSKVLKIDDPFAQNMLATFIRNKNRPGSPDLDTDYIIAAIDAEEIVVAHTEIPVEAVSKS